MRCGNPEKQQIPTRAKLNIINYDDRGNLSNAFVTKAGEVPTPNKQARSIAHRTFVQTIFYPPDIALCECAPSLRYLIEVHACHCVTTGIEFVRGIFDLEHIDIRRQPVIELVEQINPLYSWSSPQSSNLSKGVHARVGAASTD
jgi:hypothetical protein